MKALLIALSLLFSPFSILDTQESAEIAPKLSLYESIEHVKIFLNQEAKQDYSDKFLSGVRLEYVGSHPKQGLAWIHFYNNKKAGFGGEISIYHYLDGDIIELHHGP